MYRLYSKRAFIAVALVLMTMIPRIVEAQGCPTTYGCTAYELDYPTEEQATTAMHTLIILGELLFAAAVNAYILWALVTGRWGAMT